MGTEWGHAIGLAGLEPDLLVRLSESEPETPLEDVEGIGDGAVAMPRHHLRRRDLELVDTKARPRRMLGTTLDLVEVTRIGNGFHPALPQSDVRHHEYVSVRIDEA